jgi:hypothetical protein
MLKPKKLPRQITGKKFKLTSRQKRLIYNPEVLAKTKRRLGQQSTLHTQIVSPGVDGGRISYSYIPITGKSLNRRNREPI